MKNKQHLHPVCTDPYSEPSVIRRFKGGLSLSLTVDQHCSFIPPHTHLGAFLVVPLEGDFWETGDLPRNHFCHGVGLYRPAHDTHQNLVGTGGTRLLNIAIPEILLDELCRARRGEKFFAPLGAAELRCVNEIISLLHGDQRLDAQTAQGLIKALLQGMTERKTTAEALLLEADRMIKPQHEGISSLTDLAKCLRVDAVWLSRAYKRCFGISLKMRVLEFKLCTAMSLLGEMEKPVSQVALDCGFYDQAQFSRMFKRCLGLTPGQFRHKARAPVNPSLTYPPAAA